jgi:hypothetical protein
MERGGEARREGRRELGINLPEDIKEKCTQLHTSPPFHSFVV